MKLTGEQILELEIELYFSEGFQCAEYETGHRITLLRQVFDIT